MAPQNGIQLSSYEFVYGQPFQYMISVGDIYVSQEVKVKNYVCIVQDPSQTSAVFNDLACIRDYFITGSPYSFDPGGKMILKTWKTESPKAN